MAFEVELGLERLVDRLDDLAEWSLELLKRSGLFRLQRWSDESDAGVVEFSLETGRAVALVGDQSLPVAVGGLGSRCITASAVSRSSVVALVNAYATGRPDGVATRCRRSPQNHRECEAQ